MALWRKTKGWENDPHGQSTSSTGAIAQEWEIGVPRIFDFHTAKVRLELGAQRQKWSHGGRKKRRDCLKSTFCSLAKVMLCLGCACTEWASRWEWGRKRRVIFDRSFAQDAGARVGRKEKKKWGERLIQLRNLRFPRTCQLNNFEPTFFTFLDRQEMRKNSSNFKSVCLSIVEAPQCSDCPTGSVFFPRNGAVTISPWPLLHT